jgi:hypothetical protein
MSYRCYDAYYSSTPSAEHYRAKAMPLPTNAAARIPNGICFTCVERDGVELPENKGLAAARGMGFRLAPGPEHKRRIGGHRVRHHVSERRLRSRTIRLIRRRFRNNPRDTA